MFRFLCYPNINKPYNYYKVDFHSIKCTFIKYSLNYKDYKCLTDFGKIFISYIIFDEHSFFFVKKIHIASSLTSYSFSQFDVSTQLSSLLFLYHHILLKPLIFLLFQVIHQMYHKQALFELPIPYENVTNKHIESIVPIISMMNLFQLFPIQTNHSLVILTTQ